MSFGDIEPDDAYGTEPADPEQVAIILHKLIRDTVELNDGAWLQFEWHSLSELRRMAAINVIVLLLQKLRREGSLR